SFTIACARTVAVVVPSPAKSDDFDATSRTICAPIFSNLSSSSISSATATPSLVMRGAPYDLSSTTLRPLGPSVTRTALVRMSSRATSCRAHLLKILRLSQSFLFSVMFDATVLGGLLAGDGLFDHAHNVALFHDQILDTVNLNLSTRPFAEQHAVARLQIDWDELASLVPGTWTDGDHLS